MTRPHLFLKTAVVLTVFVIVITCMMIPVNAESDDILVLMVKSNEGQGSNDKYMLELEGISTTEQLTITLTFNSTANAHDRLFIQESYDITFDSSDSNVYYVSKDENTVCTVRYTGTEDILFNEYARLEVSSSEYYVRLVEVKYGSVGNAYNPLESTGVVIVVILCSLIPFILEVPSVMEDLQDALEAEVSSFGTYGRLFRLFIPLIAVSLTFLLLQTLG